MSRKHRQGPSHEMQGREVGVRCSECGHETSHVVAASAEYQDEFVDGRFSVRFWDEYQVVECLGCHGKTFRHRHRNTEHTDHDPDTEEEFLIDTIKLYPEPDVSRPPLRDADLLPARVSGIYEETLRALATAQNILAGIGIRALVESMCKDRSAIGGNLEERIDSLVKQGMISTDGAEILHSLRIMGNEAAHEVKPQATADLNVAISVIEHALQGIYILPAQAQRLPRRKPRGDTDEAK